MITLMLVAGFILASCLAAAGLIVSTLENRDGAPEGEVGRPTGLDLGA